MDEFSINKTLVDKKQVRRAFSRAAPGYDAAAVVQREVCRRMLERLDYVRLQPTRILDAGCGTGWGARQLSERYSGAHVVALDIAIGMLAQSSAQSGWWQKLFGSRHSHLCADVEALPLAANSVEMVWSNLTLQWCNDLPATLRGLHGVLKTEGLLMFSTFGPDTLKELRDAFSGVDDNSHVNRFTDMHDLGDMLSNSGFADPVMDMEIITLTYADVKAVMRDLHGIGAQNATAGRARGMMGKAAWRRVAENYERHRSGGKLPATFEIVYGHAWKPAPRMTADGAQIVHFKR
jgi:malonyl-CoA O-methyltransferase